MSKAVNTINNYLPLLRQIREFKEIAKTEDVELNLIYKEIERVLNNLFIDTSDEYGISRLEKIIGITPAEGDTLEERKVKVFSRWNDRVPYTDRELYNRLLSLCGKDKFNIIENYKEYELTVITNVGLIGRFDEVCRVLDLMLPCNLVIAISNELEEIGSNVAGLGIAVSTSMYYTVTNDLDSSYQIQLPHNEAVGIAVASNNLVTNDIQVTNEIKGNAVVTGALSTGTTVIIN